MAGPGAIQDTRAWINKCNLLPGAGGGREAKGEVFSFVETSHMNLFLKYTNLLKEPKDWQELRFTQPP